MDIRHCTRNLLTSRRTWSRGQRRSQTGTWLEVALLVHTQDEFMLGEGSSVQINQGPHELGKACVARYNHFWRVVRAGSLIWILKVD